MLIMSSLCKNMHNNYIIRKGAVCVKKIYYNADVLTMDEMLPNAEAVVVKDGKITFVGTNEEALKQKDGAEIIDLGKNTLLPGFIDAHSHFSGMAFSTLHCSLEGAKSFDEIKNRIIRFIKERNISEGEWIVADNYDQNILEERAHPTAKFIDEFASNYAVSLQHKSGHMGVFNSLALEKLGVNIDTPNREGGLIGKDEDGLTGYMEEADYIEYIKAKPMPSQEDIFSGFCSAQKTYASYGITTAQEGLFVKELSDLYKALQTQNMLDIDIVGYVDCNNKELLLEQFNDCIKEYKSHFKIGGIKLLLDGSPQGKTAWMKTPYVGEKGYCGYPAMKEEKILEQFKYAMEKELQVLAHCNGDAACEQYIRAVEKTREGYPIIDDMRTVMVHAQFLQKGQVPALKVTNMIPSFFVAHVYHWGDVHVQNFGEERAEQICPVKTAIDNGIVYTFHQDSPIIMPDMIETLWIATNRKSKAGKILGTDECISVYEALKGITINAAYQYFEEDKKGSITVGKVADFVVLDKNPLKMEKEELRDIKILETIKDGNRIFKRVERSL